MQKSHTSRCPLCARVRTAADAAGLAWSSTHHTDGSVEWVCPSCTREQLWRIEAQFELVATDATGVRQAA